MVGTHVTAGVGDGVALVGRHLRAPGRLVAVLAPWSVDARVGARRSAAVGPGDRRAIAVVASTSLGTIGWIVISIFTACT